MGVQEWVLSFFLFLLLSFFQLKPTVYIFAARLDIILWRGVIIQSQMRSLDDNSCQALPPAPNYWIFPVWTATRLGFSVEAWGMCLILEDVGDTFEEGTSTSKVTDF